MLNINGKKLCPNCFESLQDYDKKCSSCQNSGYISEAGVLLIGTILMGKYIVGKVIGRGGFGITYLGYDINNDRKVAIKEYLPEGLAYIPLYQPIRVKKQNTIKMGLKSSMKKQKLYPDSTDIQI